MKKSSRTGAYIKIRASDARFVAGIVRANPITRDHLVTAQAKGRSSETGTFLDKYRLRKVA